MVGQLINDFKKGYVNNEIQPISLDGAHHFWCKYNNMFSPIADNKHMEHHMTLLIIGFGKCNIGEITKSIGEITKSIGEITKSWRRFIIMWKFWFLLVFSSIRIIPL